MSDDRIKFECNICGLPGGKARSALDREAASCDKCGSSGRFRWIVHALSSELFGRSLNLPDFPQMRCIRGLGLSDWSGNAEPLHNKFSYTNSFLHTHPHFDLTRIAPEDVGQYDFVIATEVLEHVQPPAEQALRNLSSVLKPGGFVLLTTPSIPGDAGFEHFPSLHDYGLVELASGWVLVNRSASGRLETFEELSFHGGDGSTVEMRVFALERLIADLKDAGFEEVELATDSIEERGILLTGHCSYPMIVRKPGQRDWRLWASELTGDLQNMRRREAELLLEKNKGIEKLLASNDRIRCLDIELEERGRWAQRIEEEMRELRSLVRSLQTEVAEKGAWGRRLDKELEEQTKWAMSLDQECKALKAYIERIEASRLWQLMQRIRGVRARSSS